MKTKNLLLTAIASIGMISTTIAQVPNYVPNNGLVGWWEFNGNANDGSGNANNGTVNGATLTNDRFGNANKAYNFDGLTNKIIVGSSSTFDVISGNSITIACWLKHTGSANINKYFIAKYSGLSNTGAAFALGTGLQGNGYTWHQIASGNTNGREIQGNNIINDGQWHFVTSVLEMGVSTKLYIDGILDSSVTFPLTGSIINNINLYFGCGSNSLQYYKGTLDDIGIWNRVLSQQEIKNLYNGNICYQNITVTDTLIINANITGFNPVTYQNTIKLYPNPSNDHITIDYGNFATLNGYSLKITNSLGQVVFTTAINQQTSYVSLSSWTGNGMYFVSTIDAQGNTVDIKKLVIQ